MNRNQGHKLVKDMLAAPGVIRNFRTADLSSPLRSIKATNKLFLTGEGSSRLFPAKNAIYQAQVQGLPIAVHTEAARQASELDLSGFTLFGASNSGKTKEVISLFRAHPAMKQFGLTASRNTPLEKECDGAFILGCGPEGAVAATKSAVEQALFYQNLLGASQGDPIPNPVLEELASKCEAVLTQEIDPNIVSLAAEAPVLYFAGRNNGVAEEAALKTNEITGKKSNYLEGTYAVHGIEEAMNPDELVVVIEPFAEEEQKFREVLIEGVGMNVVAISRRGTSFPTIKIPALPGFDGYLQLMACWNLLVAVGIATGVNIDKPTRARKVGNELR